METHRVSVSTVGENPGSRQSLFFTPQIHWLWEKGERVGKPEAFSGIPEADVNSRAAFHAAKMTFGSFQNNFKKSCITHHLDDTEPYCWGNDLCDDFESQRD